MSTTESCAPQHDSSNSGLCCICLESLDTPGLGCQTLGCGHKLHEKCVSEMRRLGASASCPICRRGDDDLAPVGRMFDEAVALFLRARYVEAFPLLSRICDLDPQHTNALSLMATCFQGGIGVHKNEDRATELKERLSKLDNACQHVFLYDKYMRMGRQHEAEEQVPLMIETCLERGVQLEASFWQARLAQIRGDATQAERMFWVAHWQGSALATYELLIMHFDRNDWKQAEKLALHTVLRPVADLIAGLCEAHRIQAMNILGHCYLNQNRLNEAKDAYLCAMLQGCDVAFGNLRDVLAIIFHNHPQGSMTKGLHDYLVALLGCLREGADAGQPPNLLAIEDLHQLNATVQIRNLRSEAGKHLNGKTGIVLGIDPHGPPSDRLAVAISGLGTKLIKRSNLKTVSAPPRPPSEDLLRKLIGALTASTPQDRQDGSVGCKAQEAAISDATLMDAILRSSVPDEPLPVVILEYSKHNEWFRDVFAESPQLENIRQALQICGFRIELESGAKCVMRPEHVKAVLQDVCERGEVLDRRHVVVSADLEDIVKDVIEEARQSVSRKERGSFKLKGRTEVDVSTSSGSCTSSFASSLDAGFVLVKRTFIHVQLPSSVRSVSSVRPATM
eukprot:TRINITY_DN16208_c0_g1_i2.p1 TRINITY_DN16208_c0_g1~~TRINITY_DN16208_c0_g1_i2.p1  ORF type:complete len:620 (+),score=76.69 TRINITY_DN16208_c0_g1_i2:89-1948(+)